MKASLALLAVAAVAMMGSSSANGQTAPLTNSVTGTASLVYFINGQPNPTLTLMRGVTYRFVLNASGHPFFIQTNQALFGAGRYDSGVSGNGEMFGTLTFAVPEDAPDQLYYQCGNHGGMGGSLVIVSPPSPPQSGRIVDIEVGESVVTLRSLGASGWTAIPQFSSNLVENAWADVPVFNNTFESGTNVTTFDRLDPICGPNVFLRVRNEQQ